MERSVERAHHSWIRIIVLVTLILSCIVAGYAGGLLSQSSSELSIDQVPPPRTVVFEDASAKKNSRSILDSGTRAREINESIVTLYLLPASFEKQTPNRQFVTEKELLTEGVVLTTDGWVVVPDRKELKNARGLLRVRDFSKTLSPIEKRVDDPALGVVYLKLPQQHMKPVQFLSSNAQISQQVGYVVSGTATAPLILSLLQYRSASQPTDYVQLSSTLAKRINPDQVFSHAGLPVVTEGKELVGLTMEHGILPGFYLKDSFNSVLRSGRVERPDFTVSYLDIAQLPNIPAHLNVPSERLGALLVIPGRLRVKTQEGNDFLLDGDVVASVGDDHIDQNRSLSEIIQQYKPGDIVPLVVLRGGIQKTIRLILQ